MKATWVDNIAGELIQVTTTKTAKVLTNICQKFGKPLVWKGLDYSPILKKGALKDCKTIEQFPSYLTLARLC